MDFLKANFENLLLLLFFFLRFDVIECILLHTNAGLIEFINSPSGGFRNKK